MKKKVFVIGDRDAGYVERLGSYLERWEGGSFEVHGFTGEAALAAYLQENQPDLLLLGRELAAGELWQLAEKTCRVCLVLSESAGSGEGTVYRYQSAERILRQMLACYERTVSPPEKKAHLPVEIYGVYSPVKRCYKTTFSLILGQFLAERGATLYLNLEDSSGFPALLSEGYEENLSDILYYYRVKQPGYLKLYSVVRRLGKLSYVPPVVCPEDIRELEAEELIPVLAAIGAMEEYSFLVMDLGDALRSPLPLLQLCRRVYMPIREDAVSRARVEAFRGWLKGNGDERVLDAVRCLVLPELPHMEAGQLNDPNLLASPLGRYLEHKWQEEGEWNGCGSFSSR